MESLMLLTMARKALTLRGNLAVTLQEAMDAAKTIQITGLAERGRSANKMTTPVLQYPFWMLKLHLLFVKAGQLLTCKRKSQE